jgi:hypothetical protein
MMPILRNLPYYEVCFNFFDNFTNMIFKGGGMYHVQRVSAKHGVKDDFAFLWEHAIFRHPPNRNPLTDRSEILHS